MDKMLIFTFSTESLNKLFARMGDRDGIEAASSSLSTHHSEHSQTSLTCLIEGLHRHGGDRDE